MPRAGRRLALPALGLLVLVLHLQLGRWVAEAMPALGAGDRASSLQRLRADFTVELRPSVPPEPPAAVPAPQSRKRRAATAMRPAAAGASQPQAQPEQRAEVTEPPQPAASIADAAAPAEAPEAAAPAEAGPASAPLALAQAEPAASAPAPYPAFAASASEPSAPASAPAPAPDPGPGPEWPRATRLSYVLTGYYRGPVDGRALVEWLREGARYQVHLEVAIGPAFAPLMSRRMSSDGLITPEGLRPRHYEEETRVVPRDTRRQVVRFDEATLRLATGVELPRPPGVQDTASQFVQLTWLFTTQPRRLRTGEAVELVLALPRRVDPWVYDVLGVETLYTGAGPIEAVHVKPRRLLRPGGELAAELWVAPTLQYLPVRIVIRQDTETYVDLLLDRHPQQDAAEPKALR